MADETARVDYIFTQKGIDAIKRDVASLRKELGASGVDANTFEKQLGGIEKRMQTAGQQVKSTNENLAAQRYALYDLARTYAIIGTAMAGVGLYAVVMGAQFESAFTAVERTLQTDAIPSEVNAIRQSLIELSGQIPLTFAELSQIATIGNQMGIAKDDVIDFTGTVARFASVTGLSIDATTQAFGGFMAQTGLAPKYLENLGSAVAKVGIDSNATEAQIVSLMREIAAGGVGAGFTADQIVGLAGTLASLQIAPERARGSLDTYFGTLASAVASGGEDLEKFATIVGVSADELDRMVRNGEGVKVMEGFLTGLNDFDSVAVTQAFDDLGLSQLRVSNTFKRLSGDMSLFARDQENAKSAFIEGAELSRQYAFTVDDLNSQWIIFINNLNAIVATISGGAIPGISALFQMVNNVLSAFQQWLGDNKWATTLLVFAGVMVTVLGIMALYRAAVFTANGAMLAFRMINAQAGGGAITTGAAIRGLASSFFGLAGATTTAAKAMRIFRLALISTGVGAALVIGGELLSGLMGAGNAAESSALSMQEYNDAMAGMNQRGGEAYDTTKNLEEGLGGVGGAAGGAAAKVRTLVDYMNDLQGVFGRSSDLRFGSGAAMDDVTLKWIEMNDEIEKYMATVRSLTADRALKEYWLGVAELYDDQIRAAQLREDIAKIDDELAVANAGASRELVGNSKAAIENRKRMRDLVGGYENYILALASAGATQEEIQQILGSLNGEFMAQGQALGFSGAELAVYQARFSDMATIVSMMPRDITIGFNGDPALQAMNEFFAKATESAGGGGGDAGGAYGGAFDTALNEALPEYSSIRSGSRGGSFGREWWDEWMTSWAEGGLQWLPILGSWMEGIGKWWVSGGREWALQAWRGISTWFETNNVGTLLLNMFFPPSTLEGAWNFGARMVNDLFGGAEAASRGKSISINANGKVSVGGGFANGGFTGRGGKYDPAGIVHRGEHVVPKQFVNQRTGMPEMSYMQSMQRATKAPQTSYANGGYVGGGMSGPIELGPASLGFLANALSVRMRVDGRELAKASSRGDKSLARAGSK